MLKHGRTLLTVFFAAIIVWQWGSAIRIEAKAQLAQVLIKDAWEKKLQSPNDFAAPWPWADTEPVARLQWLDNAAQVKRDLYVLAGAHGRTLAFGPGLLDGLKQSSAQVIGGHRDTHFAFLKHIKHGDRFRMQTPDGRWQDYAVSHRRVVDSRNTPLWIDPDKNSLWLVTCYPFHAIAPGGPLRFVVRADLATTPIQTTTSL